MATREVFALDAEELCKKFIELAEKYAELLAAHDYMLMLLDSKLKGDRPKQ